MVLLITTRQTKSSFFKPIPLEYPVLNLCRDGPSGTFAVSLLQAEICVGKFIQLSPLIPQAVATLERQKALMPLLLGELNVLALRIECVTNCHDRTRKYYYLTRFMFAFVLISLVFAVCSLFLGVFALCSRIGSYMSSFLCSIALFFQTLTAALMT